MFFLLKQTDVWVDVSNYTFKKGTFRVHVFLVFHARLIEHEILTPSSQGGPRFLEESSPTEHGP